MQEIIQWLWRADGIQIEVSISEDEPKSYPQGL